MGTKKVNTIISQPYKIVLKIYVIFCMAEIQYGEHMFIVNNKFECMLKANPIKWRTCV